MNPMPRIGLPCQYLRHGERELKMPPAQGDSRQRQRDGRGSPLAPANWMGVSVKQTSLLMVTLDVICFVLICMKKGSKCNHQSSQDWNDLEVA